MRDQKVEKLQVAGPQLNITYKDGTEKTSRKEDFQDVVSIFYASGVDLTATDVTVEDVSLGQLLGQFLVNVVPVVALIGFTIFMFRQARGAQDGIMGIGRSKAKVFVKGKQDVKFKDVCGMTEA